MSIGAARPPLAPALILLIHRLGSPNTYSPNRQSKQPFHQEFISNFHMDYDVGLTSNNSSLAVNKKGL